MRARIASLMFLTTLAATASPARAQVPTGESPCVGDCGGTHMVDSPNVITLLNIVLGSTPQSACANGIPSGAPLSVTLIIQAVHNAMLAACPRTAAQACVATGGTASTGLCCTGIGDFPNTCTIGPCGCAPQFSHEIQMCDCGEGKCFGGATVGCVSR